MADTGEGAYGLVMSMIWIPGIEDTDLSLRANSDVIGYYGGIIIMGHYVHKHC